MMEDLSRKGGLTVDNQNEEIGTVLEEQPDPEQTEWIEDEPDRIDLLRFLRKFLRYWKVLLVLMAVCGLGMGILRPGSTSTHYAAQCMVYIPPYASREVEGRQVIYTNNISQLKNALGLIQSKVYRDIIAQELGVDSLSGFGSYSLSKQEGTELVTINTSSSSIEKAEELCTAVLNVFQNKAGAEVSIQSMLVVDPVTGYSTVTVTSTSRSVIRGAAIGFGLYCIYVLVKFFSDRTLHDREEAEEYLGLPVLCVIPETDVTTLPSSSDRSGGIQKWMRRLPGFRGIQK